MRLGNRRNTPGIACVGIYRLETGPNFQIKKEADQAPSQKFGHLENLGIWSCFPSVPAFIDYKHS